MTNRKWVGGVGAVAAVALLGVPVAQSASVKDPEVRAAGDCTRASSSKLKLSGEDGRIEVEFEVDQNRVGRRWSVVLRQNGGYMLAVLPASHYIRLADLREQVGRDVDLADEHDIGLLFRDCAQGAVPPVGECYGLDVIVDDSIEAQPDVYLEAGDHATVVHVDQAQFARLMDGAQHRRFSVHH